MQRYHVSKVAITVAALAVAMLAVSSSRSFGEDKKQTDKTATGKRTADKPVVTEDSTDTETPKHRLPAHYASIVDQKQREKIYGIQDAYAERIEKLQAQLDAATARRDAEIRDVLTATQQKQLDAAIAEANAKKHKSAAEKDNADSDAKATADAKDVKDAKTGSDKTPGGDTKTKKPK